MYSCGPTVYWFQHIGNLKSYIFADTLKRVLMYNEYKIKHVMNITDVGHLTSDSDEGDDKMEKAAIKEGKKAEDIANYYLRFFQEDLKKLNILFPNVWCKATEHIKEQIDAFKKYDDTKTQAAAKELQKALKAWMKDKGAGWKNSTRNSGGIVELLVDEVEDAV